MIMSGGALRNIVFLNSQAKPKAPSVPSAYMRNMMPTLVSDDCGPLGSSVAIMSR